jgi:hypothetical protein
MRLVALIFLPLAAWGQIVPGDLRETVPLLSRPPLPRGGLVAGWDLRNTGDVQSVPNLVPGGAALQRGSAAGADTNDPTPSAAGWVFATDDFATVGSHLLNGADVLGGDSPFSVFVVSNLSTGTIISRGAVDTSANRTFHMLRAGTNTDDAWVFRGGALTQVARASGYALTGFVYAGGSTGTGYSGTTTVSVPKGAAAVQSGNILIGQRDGSGFPATGTISYVLIYNRALNPREIARVHRWLRAKMAEASVVLP